MKQVNTILAILFLIVVIGCGRRKQTTDDVITVDVTKRYSAKKELILQDFMDVEYVKLETNDSYLNQGLVKDIGKEFILVTNRNQDGNIFVYDRNGKGISKFNRKGQGPGEYTSILSITLDENNGEMFVYDLFTQTPFVYDLFGNFKRSIGRRENDTFRVYSALFNYDDNNLIVYDRDTEEKGYYLVSKKDGSITKEIKIPYVEKKLLLQSRSLRENEIGETTSFGTRTGFTQAAPNSHVPIIPYYDNWILLEYSSDTLYQFLPDSGLLPFIVRTPSIQSMNPEIMLILRLFSGRYLFFETVTNEFNWDTNRGFERSFFMYDKQKKDFSGYTIYNGDYSTKKEIYLSSFRLVNHEIVLWQPLEAYQLVKDYQEGRLKDGKLKEIAATLDVEDNPVIMLIKHKK